MLMFQILLDGAEPCDAGTTQLSSPVCRRGGQQVPLSICVVVHAHNMPKQAVRLGGCHNMPTPRDGGSEPNLLLRGA